MGHTSFSIQAWNACNFWNLPHNTHRMGTKPKYHDVLVVSLDILLTPQEYISNSKHPIVNNPGNQHFGCNNDKTCSQDFPKRLGGIFAHISFLKQRMFPPTCGNVWQAALQCFHRAAPYLHQGNGRWAPIRSHPGGAHGKCNGNHRFFHVCPLRYGKKPWQISSLFPIWNLQESGPRRLGPEK